MVVDRRKSEEIVALIRKHSVKRIFTESQIEWYVENSKDQFGHNVSTCCGAVFTYPLRYGDGRSVLYDTEFVCTKCKKMCGTISLNCYRNPGGFEFMTRMDRRRMWGDEEE